MCNNMCEKQPLVGIIVPVYNVEPYVSRCLDSLLNNTYNNFLLFCVNDGSTDNSAAVVEEYAKRDKRIILIEQENQGVSSARNNGLKAAFEKNCDVIGFVDSDDWVYPQYIEILLSGILDGYDISMCEYIRTDKYIMGQFISECRKDKFDNSDAIENDNLRQTVWAKLFRSELVKDICFKNITSDEDVLYNIGIYATHKVKICCFPLKLYYYFFDERCTLSKRNGYQSGIVYGNEIIRLLNNKNCLELMKPFLVKNGLSTCMKFRYFSKFTNEYQKYKAEYNNLMKEIWGIAKERKIRIKNKFVLKLFTYFPSLYRLFRIATDRTMLNFERNQKARMRNENSNNL